MPIIHQSAVGAIFLDRDDLQGTPYGKLTVRQNRQETSLHLNEATLLSVAAGLIRQAQEINADRRKNGSTDNADVGAPQAKAL